MQKILNWIDDRFPLTALWEVAVGQVRRAEEFQLLVLLRLAGAVRAGDADRHRHLPDDELQARCDARRSSRSSTSCATWRGAGSSATCTRPARRCSSSSSTCTCSAALMYGSYRKPRELMWIFGCLIYLALMARGVLRLPAAVGPDVVLGRAGDRQPVLDGADHRRRPRHLDPRRLHDLRRHAQPLLRVPRDRRAAGAADAWSPRT